MNDNTAVIAAEIVVFIKANDKIRGIYWTAKNIAGHGFSVPVDKIKGGKGRILPSAVAVLSVVSGAPDSAAAITTHTSRF
jgi:hypothetical protein